MGLGDYHRCQQRTSRGLHGAPCPAAPWSPAPAHAAYAAPGSPWVAGAHEQARLTNPVLEHLRRQLERAFQRAVARGRARRAREAVEAAAAAAAAAREERNRMRMECALARLRAELLELRFQNHQLASTLLDLNTKMRQLKQQHELDGASRPGSPEDKAMSP
uniref:alanine and arginine-rich domain-containing protein n=1 Tax=Jaculus jaculus TaxID=51337 RepID=UPI001E1B422A|nr:alanine and arginine-rich domain-containing protein [Jaculus jaculus]